MSHTLVNYPSDANPLVKVVSPEGDLTPAGLALNSALKLIANTVVLATSGYSGKSGYSGRSGYSGTNGTNGTSGFSGYSGKSGYSGIGTSGYSGIGTSGYSGVGTSGYSGVGNSGFSGVSGISGYSGFSGTSGFSGYSGRSGYSGVGTSGYSGVGVSGFSGNSGVSGYSGAAPGGLLPYTGATSNVDIGSHSLNVGGIATMNEINIPGPDYNPGYSGYWITAGNTPNWALAVASTEHGSFAVMGADNYNIGWTDMLLVGDLASNQVACCDGTYAIRSYGPVFLGQTNGTTGGYVQIASGAPATHTSTGVAGQIAWDSGFFYVCVATNSWKRTALSSW